MTTERRKRRPGYKRTHIGKRRLRPEALRGRDQEPDLPDLEILEDRLALWDEADKCASFQSGMAAIATALLSCVRPGDVLLHSEPLYGGSDYLVRHYLPEFGVEPIEHYEDIVADVAQALDAV